MPHIFTRCLIVICLSFSAAVATADPPQQLPRTDLYGDPLPDGAIARLGTVRLRHAGLSDFVFTEDGKTILSAGNDRVLRFWDIHTGKQTRAVKLQGTAGPGLVVTLSPDGKTVVAHDKKLLVFWEVESGKEIKSLPWLKGNVDYLYFSPDGKTLAVGMDMLRVTFLDWRDGNERAIKLALDGKQFTLSADSTRHGSFSPDGKWFVAGVSWQQPLGTFEVATGREVLRLDCNATTSTVSPDSKRLAVSSLHGEFGKRETILRLFELPSGKKIAEFPQGHDRSYYSLAFSPDGKTLACGASERGCLVDCASGLVLHKLPDRPWQLAFAPDGKTLVFSESGNRLRLWNVADGKELHDRPGNFGATTAIAISPDGRQLAAADWMDRTVSLWDTINGRLLRQFPLHGKENHYVRNLAFSADGRTLTAGQYRGFLRFWDVASGKEQRAVQLHDPDRANPEFTYFYQLHVSIDGLHVSTLERIISQGVSTRLARWETGTGKLLRQETFPGEIREGAWSADGKSVALSIENVLKQVEVNTGAVCAQIPRVPNGVITISPDDRLLAAPRKSASGNDDDVAVGVWESATGKEIAKITAGRVEHLALAPDNRSLVTTYQGFLKVWDLATGKERHRWPLPVPSIDLPGRSFVLNLSLFSDGRRAFTVLADGTALVWDLASSQAAAEPLVKETTEKEIAAWWGDLIDKDAARAYAAVWRLADAPEAMVIGFLRGQLKPVPEADVKKVQQLIADLDNDAFKVRENAYRELAELGNAAVPALREALAKKPAPEVQRRLETLLSRSEKLVKSPELLRRLRAIQVLERLDSHESRRLLAELAKGMNLADETVEALRSLDRLAHRSRGVEK